jgi:Fuc2NAc and GlcNAc transferase
MESVWAIFGSFFVSFVGTRIVWWHAQRRGWMAIPNARSSHEVPTPSSGGIAIAVAFLGTVFALGSLSFVPWPVVSAIVGGGGVVAVLGWADDRYTLPPRIRIVVQLLAAMWAVWQLGGLPTLHFGSVVVTLGVVGSILAVLTIVTASNLTNFMDGIDGLVGGQAVVLGAGLGFLLAVSGAMELALVSWALAAAAGGFLVWNWEPATIFMGDAGSLLIGFSFVVLAIASERAFALSAMAFLAADASFLLDAGATTAIRARAGERWYEAHRSFAYQRAVQAGYRHRSVTLFALGCTVVLVFLAAMSTFSPRLLPLILVSAFVVSYVVWSPWRLRI